MEEVWEIFQKRKGRLSFRGQVGVTVLGFLKLEYFNGYIFQTY
jgi:hypothetical protein